MLPPGFDLLQVVEGEEDDEGVYYRVERDGSASIIGKRSKKVLSRTVEDGSKIAGGVSARGDLFGERIVKLPDGEIRRYPLRWFDSAPEKSTTHARPETSEDQVSHPISAFVSQDKTSSKSSPAVVASPDENLEALRTAAELLESFEARLAKIEADNAVLRAENAQLRAGVPSVPAMPLLPSKI
jgi:hypothetical protein